MQHLHVVFVCLGNICRSPLAEFIVRARAEQRGLTKQFTFSSAGTGDWHIGNGADKRSCHIANRYQLDLSKHCAQQISLNNYQQWHRFVVMDQDNLSNLLAMGIPSSQIIMMRQFESSSTIADVPDPYYGRTDGFETVYQILNNNADAVLDWLLSN
ncbi:MAG: low molecular weight protein-tyrosine-phosphatase [Mariprofundales bacterium]